MPVPEQGAIDNGVYAAYQEEGYLLPTGEPDWGKIREHMFEILRQSKVITKGDRAAKAVTRGKMVERVFPHLPTPDMFRDQDDSELPHAIWKTLDSKLWTVAAVNAQSALQRLVSLNMGNGYVMCRTKIGNDLTDALYVTDNVTCIEEDFIRPENTALERRLNLATRNREMLITRQPHNAQLFQRRYNHTLKALTTGASSRITLAVEAATSTDSDSEEETED